MDVRDGFIGSIGNTPLIRLEAPSKATGCNILGKAEFLNPGGSVKDRAALAIIRDAERRGLLRPGGVIVEGTAGNTGIGLALVGNALGYRTVIVIPETQSQEKKDMLRLLRRRAAAGAGGALRESRTTTCTIPSGWPRSWRQTEPNGAIWANQFDNVANRERPLRDHRPGDLAADRRHARRLHLRRRHRRHAGRRRHRAEGANPDVRIGLADPHGRGALQLLRHGELKAEGTSITEGIGQGRITRTSKALRSTTPSDHR